VWRNLRDVSVKIYNHITFWHIRECARNVRIIGRLTASVWKPINLTEKMYRNRFRPDKYLSRPVLLTEYNQNWNALTNFSKTHWHRISWQPVSIASFTYWQTDIQHDANKRNLLFKYLSKLENHTNALAVNLLDNSENTHRLKRYTVLTLPDSKGKKVKLSCA
jgi:hypothetical protein